MFGVSLVESLGEAVLKRSPWWAAGGRPHGSSPPPLCVDEAGRGLNTGWPGSRWGMRGRLGWLAQQKEGLCSSSRPLLPLRTRYGSPVACSSHGRRGLQDGCRGCPFGIKPGASVWVRKGIWRAWWKPPCYLARAQRGASHASLPTWKTRERGKHKP